MIEALETAFENARQLPTSQQQEIADLIEQKLADIGWDRMLESPRSVEMLGTMAKRVREDRRLGRTRGFPPDV